MIQLNSKIQFVLLAVSLFFIGQGINEIFQEGFKTDVSLFSQISPIVLLLFLVSFLLETFIQENKIRTMNYNNTLK